MVTKESKATKTLKLDFANVQAYLKSGKYDMEIESAEISATEPSADKKGTPFLTAHCVVINNAACNGRKVNYTWWITKDAIDAGILRNHLIVLGFDEEELTGAFDLPVDEMTGRRFNASVETDEIFPKIIKIRPYTENGRLK